MPNLIGQSLGHYHILEQLGEGGMATVYKAYDTRAECEVAVKVIRREAFPAEHHARIFKRFEREARALSKLDDPHIVRVIEYGEHKESPFLVMEYIPGGTLKQRLGKPMPWFEAVKLILPITQALSCAHKQGIIHRDVKPSNILITASGEPMLTDFGIAKMLEADEDQTLSTTTGVGIGTPEYMSPEQGLGQEVDARADIYSLGIVLYELAAGRKPFRADTPMAVIVKHVNDPLPRPRQFVSDIPETVERVLFKALAKKPENRYKTMVEFGKALDGLLEPIREREREAARKKEETAKREAEIARKAEEKKKAREAKLQRRQEREKAHKSSWLPWGLGIGLLLLTMAGVILGNQKQNVLPSTTSSPASTSTATFTVSPSLTITRLPTKTSTPIPPPPYTEGDLLFETDFESSKIDNFTFFAQSKTGEQYQFIQSQYWRIERDEVNNQMLQISVPDKTIAFSQFGNPNWENYAVEFRTRFEPANSSGQFQFATSVRWTGRDGGPQNYQVYFDHFGGVVDRADVGIWTSLVSLNHSLIKNEWNSVRVEVFDADISVYTNGKLVGVITDKDPFLKGKVVLEVGPAPVTMYFDDIRVVELVSVESTPIPDLITDEKGVIMQYVPAGEFEMGSNEISSNEKPVHTVYLDAFFIDKYEVTNAFYRKCVDAGVCAPPKEDRSYSHNNYFGVDEFANYPALYVNWEMAKTYCEWRGGRLPTEAEWEKSAAGNFGRVFPWSKNHDISCIRANYDGGCGIGDTQKAGNYPGGISAYGLFDMSGNVAEWTNSLFKPYPYDPNDGRESTTLSGERSVRGGSWNSPEGSLRSASRSKVDPLTANYLIGFRCANSNP